MLESKTFRVCFAATLLICVLPCSQTLSAQEKQHSMVPTPEYRIRAGDVTKLDVWKQPEITRTVPVDRKGNIHLPLVHGVKAAGLTAMELAGLVRHKLEGKISNPQVTVTITEISNPSALPSPLQTPGVRPLIPPSHQLQDVPSPELLQNCCVAWKAPPPASSPTA
jgi:protein involved in polysaccharide export with SLBB domain